MEHSKKSCHSKKSSIKIVAYYVLPWLLKWKLESWVIQILFQKLSWRLESDVFTYKSAYNYVTNVFMTWPNYSIHCVYIKNVKNYSHSSIKFSCELARKKNFMFVTLGKTKAVYLPLTSYRWGNWSPWDHTGYLFVFTPQRSRKQLSVHCQNPRLLTAFFSTYHSKTLLQMAMETSKGMSLFPYFLQEVRSGP